ncbi:branched-chain amino acid permease [Clostridium sp. MF28]|uniref:AzlC family ABC transporter permease n=1 Tax=Clostridium TaxID=1485 RepID=UPI000425231F|nr:MULTISPECIES: AzlC family ABC transporter permease [Clostridium]AVK48163.1 branched-chain amino acid permease [Clostridium sp. MF28]NOW87746.1 4-azaleucine resistance transporter AzlC [Clostridium beijerinckii]PSM58465.1 branched-chain amino acid transporter AzlC [Clostridium diolis]
MELGKIPNDSLEIKNKNNSYYFIQGVKDCIPTIFGYISLGLACGILSKSCGLTVWEAMGMSAFIYGGSSQFIASSMILSSSPIPSIIFTIFFVNFRHLFMSASVAPYFKENSVLKNFFIGMLLTDETFVVASAEGLRNKKINNLWITGLNITAYINWILATGIGVLIGGFIPDYKALGLDFALTAMFIGLLISSVKGNVKIRKALIIIIVSSIVLIVSAIYVSTSIGIIISAIAGALIGVVIKE